MAHNGRRAKDRSRWSSHLRLNAQCSPTVEPRHRTLHSARTSLQSSRRNKSRSQASLQNTSSRHLRNQPHLCHLARWWCNSDSFLLPLRSLRVQSTSGSLLARQLLPAPRAPEPPRRLQGEIWSARSAGQRYANAESIAAALLPLPTLQWSSATTPWGHPKRLWWCGGPQRIERSCWCVSGLRTSSTWNERASGRRTQRHSDIPRTN